MSARTRLNSNLTEMIPTAERMFELQASYVHIYCVCGRQCLHLITWEAPAVELQPEVYSVRAASSSHAEPTLPTIVSTRLSKKVTCPRGKNRTHRKSMGRITTARVKARRSFEAWHPTPCRKKKWNWQPHLTQSGGCHPRNNNAHHHGEFGLRNIRFSVSSKGVRYPRVPAIIHGCLIGVAPSCWIDHFSGTEHLTPCELPYPECSTAVEKQE